LIARWQKIIPELDAQVTACATLRIQEVLLTKHKQLISSGNVIVNPNKHSAHKHFTHACVTVLRIEEEPQRKTHDLFQEGECCCISE